METPGPKFEEANVLYSDFESVLTTRELDCLCLRCEGEKLKSIGLKLSISEFTVRNYMSSIYNKTGIRTPLVLCQLFIISKKRSLWYQREVTKGRSGVDTESFDPDPIVDNYRNVRVNRE